jgi:hypothetical protein
MKIKILKGFILIHHVFDVGGEILLSEAEQCISEDSKSSRLKLATDTRKAIIIKEAPLSVEIVEEPIKIGNRDFKALIYARIWDYGVISVTVELPIPSNTSWSELVEIAWDVEASDEIDLVAVRERDNLKKKILKSIKNPSDWEVYEDYITYIIEKIDGITSPMELIDKADVPALILAEKIERLSEDSKKLIVHNALQYSDTDMAIIDWNSALLIEPEGQRDVADVIEFCVTHLLELRYYDEQINARLDELYDTIETEKKSILNLLRNFYAKIAEESSRKYMEFSEFLGRIENSLKTVGDPYLATIFRTASHEFRFEDWRKSISRKMETLAQITQILQGEVNFKRSHYLEIIIILLIAIEIIPLFFDMFQVHPVEFFKNCMENLSKFFRTGIKP